MLTSTRRYPVEGDEFRLDAERSQAVEGSSCREGEE